MQRISLVYIKIEGLLEEVFQKPYVNLTQMGRDKRLLMLKELVVMMKLVLIIQNNKKITNQQYLILYLIIPELLISLINKPYQLLNHLLILIVQLEILQHKINARDLLLQNKLSRLTAAILLKLVHSRRILQLIQERCKMKRLHSIRFRS